MFFVGLDVSVKRTSMCIIDATGQVVREQIRSRSPGRGRTLIRATGIDVEQVGLEAGVSSAWLARGLLAKGLPAIVIDATHAAAALKTDFRNKTNRNDARGIADLMRSTNSAPSG